MAPPPTRPSWNGRLAIGSGQALYVGPGHDTSRHAHHAVQVCVALAGEFRLRCGRPPRWQRYSAAIVASDEPHELDAAGRPVALLFVEPESPAGRRLAARCGGAGVAPLPRLQAARLTALLPRLAGNESADASGLAVAALGLREAPRPLDPRVQRAVAILRAARGDYPGSAALARRVACSVGRFRHVFREQVGLAYRTYVLWLRLGDAIAAIAAGASSTEAAHAAGLADSAHLSRTLRRMFGITPSSLSR